MVVLVSIAMDIGYFAFTGSISYRERVGVWVLSGCQKTAG
jgi:hypothetical protein